MFQNYIDKYYSFLELNLSDDDVNLSEYVGSNLATLPINRFINSEISRIVSANIDQIRNQSIFDQSNADLLRLINRLEDELQNSVLLSNYDFKLFLKNIIEIRFNFICRPLTTISHIAYSNKSELTILELQTLFEFFEEYRYLLEGLSEWYENNLDKSFLIKTEFDELIKEIDDDYIYNLEKSEFISLFDVFFQLFSFDGLINAEEIEIPIESLIIYFSEKGILPILDKLEEFYNINKRLVSKEDIISLIDNLMDNSEVAGVTDLEDFELNDDDDEKESLELVDFELNDDDLDSLETEYSDMLSLGDDEKESLELVDFELNDDDLDSLETEYSDMLSLGDDEKESLELVDFELNDDDLDSLETEYSDMLSLGDDEKESLELVDFELNDDDLDSLETEYSDMLSLGDDGKESSKEKDSSDFMLEDFYDLEEDDEKEK